MEHSTEVLYNRTMVYCTPEHRFGSDALLLARFCEPKRSQKAADLCTGCQRCEINCTLTNDGVCSSYISRVKIQRRLNLDGAGNGLLSGTDNCFVYFPDTCRQCEDPACGNACPQKAIVTNEQGIRVVDTDKCIGCGACVEACPWHMPTVNPETGKSSKCIACGACVAGCPSGPLTIVDWDAGPSAAQAAYMDL